MSGWTKLFGSIVTSSIWLEDSDVLKIWIAMLALADARDTVEGTIPGFASLCRVSRQKMEEAIQKFSSPDPDSRTQDQDGRRIEIIDGGWKIINRSKYKEKHQEMIGSRAPYMRAYRAQKHINNVTKKCNMLQSTVSCNTETEIEIEKRITTSCPPVTSEFTQFWQSYPKKIGKSAALKVWEKIKNRPPIETILTAIENQKNSNQWKKENGQFIPNPTTWLNQGRWDDEIFVKKSKWD